MDKTSFVQKWKEGIELVTPIQRIKVDLVSYSIMLLGVILGIIVNVHAKVWWLVIVLSGSLLLLAMTYLGMIQKYKMLIKFEQEVYKNETEENNSIQSS